LRTEVSLVEFLLQSFVQFWGLTPILPAAPNLAGQILSLQVTESKGEAN
jgi:hypothetical protein